MKGSKQDKQQKAIQMAIEALEGISRDAAISEESRLPRGGSEADFVEISRTPVLAGREALIALKRAFLQ